MIASLGACSQQTDLEKSAEKSELTLPAESLMSVPDLIANWKNGCDEAFKEKIAVTSPDTEIYIEKNGKKIALSSIGTGITIPWLTIYNRERAPVFHQSAYNSNSIEKWNNYRDGAIAKGPWPSLEIVATYSDLDVSRIPDADLIFVKYSADWCAPCKAQSADLKIFKEQNPSLHIAHIEIVADTKNMGGKCPINL